MCFLVSAAIKLGVFDHIINLDLSLLLCGCFVRLACSSASKCSVQSSWPHYEVNQITTVEKSATVVAYLQ